MHNEFLQDAPEWEKCLGIDGAGNLLLIDEVPFPDSSRFWDKKDYEEAMKEGRDPKALDKDIIRPYLKTHCDPYSSDPLPPVPPDLMAATSKLYNQFLGRFTGSLTV